MIKINDERKFEAVLYKIRAQNTRQMISQYCTFSILCTDEYDGKSGFTNMLLKL